MACDSLLVVTEIRQALAEAKDLGDVLKIRDRADAIRRLLKIKGESLMAQNEMAEVTVRAEVLLGESMAKLEKAQGKRTDLTSLQPATKLTLSELGIEKTASHRWQTMAAAKKRITSLVQHANDQGKEFSRAMVYREGKRILNGDKEPKALDVADHVGALRKHIFRLFDDHPELKTVLPGVLREIADELTGFMEQDDGSSRRTRKAAASAA